MSMYSIPTAMISPAGNVSGVLTRRPDPGNAPPSPSMSPSILKGFNLPVPRYGQAHSSLAVYSNFQPYAGHNLATRYDKMNSTDELPQEIMRHNQSAIITGIASATCFCAVVIVAVRFWSRHYSSLPFGWDDWLTLACLPFQLAINVLAIFGAQHSGLGRPMAVILEIAPWKVTEAFQLLFVIELIYPTSLTIMKLSLLILYTRLFPTKSMKRSALVIGIICIAWCVGSIFVTTFQCAPMKKMWHPMMEGKCLDHEKFFLGTSLPNIITDVMILALPVIEVWQLQMRRGLKVYVYGMFLLGGGVVIVSSIRLRAVVKVAKQGAHGDITLSMGNLANWTVFEIMMAMLCASLPAMRPVLSFITSGRRKLSTMSRRSTQPRNSVANTAGENRKSVSTRVSQTAAPGTFENNESAEDVLWTEMQSRNRASKDIVDVYERESRGSQ